MNNKTRSNLDDSNSIRHSDTFTRAISLRIRVYAETSAGRRFHVIPCLNAIRTRRVESHEIDCPPPPPPPPPELRNFDISEDGTFDMSVRMIWVGIIGGLGGEGAPQCVQTNACCGKCPEYRPQSDGWTTWGGQTAHKVQ